MDGELPWDEARVGAVPAAHPAAFKGLPPRMNFRRAVFFMRTNEKETVLFPHPFSREYWRMAAGELKNVRVLVFAAMMIALRVALKPVSVPVAADLRINVAFFVNAYGAMIMGPVAAILAAAVTDTLGCLLFPTGTYFFPFILTEIAGSLIFALFFYRARITVRRVVLSRFCIDFFVNILLTTPIMSLYYRLVLGRNYTLFHLPRIVKNLALFPIESVLLVLFLRALIPPTAKVGFNVPPADELRFTKKNAALLFVLFALGCAAVGFYLLIRGKKCRAGSSKCSCRPRRAPHSQGRAGWSPGWLRRPG